MNRMLDPILNTFIHNQRKGFPFPQGRECEEDAHKLCGGMLRMCEGAFGCTTQCLTDHAPHLSEKCRKAHPCAQEIDDWCPHVKGGQNDMMHCLKEHQKQLSDLCVAHHPCLNASLADTHPHCVPIDYKSQPPSFIKNIQHFLHNLRHGHFFEPMPGAAAAPEDALAAVERHRTHHHHRFGGGGIRNMLSSLFGGLGGGDSPQGRNIADRSHEISENKPHHNKHHHKHHNAQRQQELDREARRLERERNELLQERRELASERVQQQHLLDAERRALLRASARATEAKQKQEQQPVKDNVETTSISAAPSAFGASPWTSVAVAALTTTFIVLFA
eukprot:TRINITY_DN60724_c0_g1_i2.p2 TRINITY_DN60724_c0_g1~~TRINITY_DN60724_c0_g1_i2.p2  ORF type:complete len:333 (+),score=138.23 TRINITY_DN60724_c0_g1_i2:111-1109(+)